MRELQRGWSGENGKGKENQGGDAVACAAGRHGATAVDSCLPVRCAEDGPASVSSRWLAIGGSGPAAVDVLAGTVAHVRISRTAVLCAKSSKALRHQTEGRPLAAALPHSVATQS